MEAALVWFFIYDYDAQYCYRIADILIKKHEDSRRIAPAQ